MCNFVTGVEGDIILSTEYISCADVSRRQRSFYTHQ
jgi:hypothetical protein